jgi:putative endonuclease
MHKQWKWYVYIIKCNDNTYYTGLTWKPEIRYEQHLSGFGGKYTKKHGVKTLAYLEEHNNLETARKREKQIKNWNQKKKLKLISGCWGKEW